MKEENKGAQFKNFQNIVINASILLGVILTYIAISVYVHIGHELSKEKFASVFDKKISADLVRHEIKQITKFGPRMFPTKENRMAGNYLVQRLKELLNSRPKNSLFDGEVEFFKVDGSFELTIIRRLTYMGYKNIPNIVFTLRPRKTNRYPNTPNNYCMYNCHYDSVNGSPGASDNAINCALLINLANYFLQMTTDDDSLSQPQCNLLFLFNGAEESAMAAANGFITKHDLKDKIKTLINLDSSGTGGRAALFQATPGASLLMKIYAKSIPHPYGTVLGEDVFRTGLLPVDTDFQIFRDYGQLQGLDIAFVGNGHQYHNIYDSDENIPDGTIINEIENLFNLAHSIFFDERINQEWTHEDYIYFDFMHQFMIILSAKMGFMVNYIIIAISIIFMIHELKVRLSADYSLIQIILMMVLFSISHFLSTLFTILNIFTLSLVITLAQAELSWYGYYFIAFILYGIPSILLFVTLEYSFINGTFNGAFPNDMEKKDALMFWTLSIIPISLLIFLTIMEIRSSYLICFVLATIILMRVLQFFITRRIFHLDVSKSNKDELAWLLIMLITIAPFILMFVTVLSGFFEAIIPIFDRTPCEVPSESIMALLMSLFTLFSFFVLSVSLFRFEKIYNFLKKVLFIFWIIILVLVLSGLIPAFVPVRAPKRILLSHADHKIFNKDFEIIENTGKMIYIASDQRCLKGFNNDLVKLIKPLCNDEPFCFSVHPFTLIKEYRSSIFYKLSDIPDISDTLELSLSLDSIKKTPLEDNEYIVSFTLVASEVMSFDFVMNSYFELLDWSFDFPVKSNSQTNDGNLIFNILYLFDLESSNLNFWLKVRTSTDFKIKLDCFHIILVQHVVNNVITPELKKTTDNFDDFVAPTFDRTRWHTYPIFLI